ncbi:MAG: SRPBCC family protein [Thermoleophilaceae bacterium]
MTTGSSCGRGATVRWPEGHEPAGAALHEVNACASGADPEAVWAWLVRPDRWREFYGNALRVRHRAGPWPELALGTRFSWVTFGAPVTTEVTELETPYRLAWTGGGLGSVGHHGWVLTPTATGCEIRTEETQRGRAVGLLGPVLRPAVRHFHQRWVEGAARIAETGRRP